jgi:hypothetical protein
MLDPKLDRPPLDDDRHALGEALRQHLADARRWREARATPADSTDSGHAADHDALRRWQSARLAESYADLLADARYAPAARFFLTELYGPQDFSARDAEVARVLPTLVATLPAKALAALVEALRMDALSESLDADMVRQLRAAGRAQSIDTAAYAAAYRACGRLEDRQTQIDLVQQIGHTLERLTRKPLLATTLKLMRRPAELAGLGQLHRFLHEGFEAFRRMGDAERFLATVRDRETALMQRWSAPA